MRPAEFDRHAALETARELMEDGQDGAAAEIVRAIVKAGNIPPALRPTVRALCRELVARLYPDFKLLGPPLRTPAERALCRELVARLHPAPARVLPANVLPFRLPTAHDPR